jgi:hypothetical protein
VEQVSRRRFNFLGFTHICGQSRKYGKFLVLRKTVRKRFLAKLQELKKELRRPWHEPVAELGQSLRSVVQGYFNYHAVPGNLARLNRFRQEALTPCPSASGSETPDDLGSARTTH